MERLRPVPSGRRPADHELPVDAGFHPHRIDQQPLPIDAVDLELPGIAPKPCSPGFRHGLLGDPDAREPLVLGRAGHESPLGSRQGQLGEALWSRGEALHVDAYVPPL
ncbi:MAG TPA: hypothetical protein VE735_03445, partial [Gammaproteobacteria bacterium]|nr:hypothetical protein [Gammaproteobacteria bacterium]